jgi:hypothetical protein
VVIASYNQHIGSFSPEPFGWLAPPSLLGAREPTLSWNQLHQLRSPVCPAERGSECNRDNEMVRRPASQPVMMELAKSQTEDHTMQIKSIGIDLGKTTFHLIALGSRSQVVIRKKFSRSQLLVYTANLPASLIGMEAGVGSHFLGRALREQGHEVRLIPAQFVRPFVKSNKNDYCDAETIAEAVERENMRFVPTRRRISSICKLSIECATGWWPDGPA